MVLAHNTINNIKYYHLVVTYGENKKNWVEISKQLLEILDNGLNNIITGDETWFHFYTVPSKESNKTWVKSEENWLQIARTAQNAKKRMFCILKPVNF